MNNIELDENSYEEIKSDNENEIPNERPSNNFNYEINNPEQRGLNNQNRINMNYPQTSTPRQNQVNDQLRETRINQIGSNNQLNESNQGPREYIDLNNTEIARNADLIRERSLGFTDKLADKNSLYNKMNITVWANHLIILLHSYALFICFYKETYYYLFTIYPLDSLINFLLICFRWWKKKITNFQKKEFFPEFLKSTFIALFYMACFYLEEGILRKIILYSSIVGAVMYCYQSSEPFQQITLNLAFKSIFFMFQFWLLGIYYAFDWPIESLSTVLIPIFYYTMIIGFMGLFTSVVNIFRLIYHIFTCFKTIKKGKLIQLIF